MNIAYRWFLGFSLTTTIPHFATVSYAFATNSPETVIEQIFKWILGEAPDKGFVDASMVFVDSTPVKASANRHKGVRIQVEKKARSYERQLRKEINLDRLAHDKKSLKDKDDSDDRPPETREATQSKTDPERGILRKGEHKVDLSYSVHTACDDNNFVLAAEATAANIHDSQVFEEVYDKGNEEFDPAEAGCHESQKTSLLGLGRPSCFFDSMAFLSVSRSFLLKNPNSLVESWGSLIRRRRLFLLLSKAFIVSIYNPIWLLDVFTFLLR